MPPVHAETLELAQRRAVQEYRQRLAAAATRRFGGSAAVGQSDVLQWLMTVSTDTCCSPSGVHYTFDPADSDARAVPDKRRRVMPPPPELPKAVWNVTPEVPPTTWRTVSTETDAVQPVTSSAVPSKADAPADSTAPSATRSPEEEQLRRRVIALSKENAELERRLERLKSEMAHLKKSRRGSPTPPQIPSTPPEPPLLTRGPFEGSSSGRPPSPTRSRSLVIASTSNNNNSNQHQGGGGRNVRVYANPKARALQAIRELRSKLAVVRTGVKALAANDLFHNAASLLLPFLQQHVNNAKRMVDRADFFEKTAQGMQAKLLSLPDTDSPEGYEVQLSPDGRNSALLLDAKTWNEFTHAFTATVDAKFVKVEDFTNRGARSLMKSATTEREMKRSVADLEMRCGELESVTVDWESLAIAIASDAIFEAVTVQPCKKLEFAALQKQLADSNDEVRVVCGVSGWFAKPSTRVKASVWRDKRADTLNRVEQLLSQELQHFMMNGPQRNSLRRKVLLLRELAALLQRLRTDTDPLPAAAALIASNHAILVHTSAPNSASVTPSASPAGPIPPYGSGNAARPGANRPARDLQVAGIRGSVAGETSGGSRRGTQSHQGMSLSGGPQRGGSTVRSEGPCTPDSVTTPTSSSSRMDPIVLPAVGTPGPRSKKGTGNGGKDV
jgi:hypothetical protein